MYSEAHLAALVLTPQTLGIAVALCAAGVVVTVVPHTAGMMAVLGLGFAVAVLPYQPVLLLVGGLLSVCLITRPTAPVIALGICFGLAASGAGFVVYHGVQIAGLPLILLPAALGSLLLCLYFCGIVQNDRPVILGMATIGFLCVPTVLLATPDPAVQAVSGGTSHELRGGGDDFRSYI